MIREGHIKSFKDIQLEYALKPSKKLRYVQLQHSLKEMLEPPLYELPLSSVRKYQQKLRQFSGMITGLCLYSTIKDHRFNKLNADTNGYLMISLLRNG